MKVEVEARYKVMQSWVKGNTANVAVAEQQLENESDVKTAEETDRPDSGNSSESGVGIARVV